MTHDDSVQTAATSQRARSPASIGAREPRAPVDARRRSNRSSNPGRAKRGIGFTTEAKFTRLQGLENSQNGERISTFPDRVASGEFYWLVRSPVRAPSLEVRAFARWLRTELEADLVI